MKFVVALIGMMLSAPLVYGETPGIRVDKEKGQVIIDAKVAPRKLPNLDQVYPIEVIASWPAPKGKKAHETVVTFDVKPSEVHQALESLGLKPGKPVRGGETAATGPDILIALEFMQDGEVRKISIDKLLIDSRNKKPFPKSVKFRFTGSVASQLDPNKPDTIYGADLSGTLIAIYPVTDETVLQSTLTMKEEKYLKLEVNKELLPKEGTEVKLILEIAK